MNNDTATFTMSREHFKALIKVITRAELLAIRIEANAPHIAEYNRRLILEGVAEFREALAASREI